MKMNVPPLSSIHFYYGLYLSGAGFQAPAPLSRSPGLLLRLLLHPNVELITPEQLCPRPNPRRFLFFCSVTFIE